MMSDEKFSSRMKLESKMYDSEDDSDNDVLSPSRLSIMANRGDDDEEISSLPFKLSSPKTSSSPMKRGKKSVSASPKKGAKKLAPNKMSSSKASSKKMSASKASPMKRLNTKAQAPVSHSSPRKEDQILNPKTGLFVGKNTRVGKQVIKEAGGEANASRNKRDDMIWNEETGKMVKKSGRVAKKLSASTEKKKSNARKV